MRKVSGLEAYAELTGYLDASEKAQLDHQLNQIPKNSAEYKALAQKIEKGVWQELFQRDNFPLEALYCLREGSISAMSFSTSQMFYNVYRHPKNTVVRIEPVFNNGKIVPNSRQMIVATMRLASSSLRAYAECAKEEFSQSGFLPEGIRDLPDFLSYWQKLRDSGASQLNGPKEVENFYRRLLQYPESEHYFLLLPDPHFDGHKIKHTTSLIQQINYRIGFNPFCSLLVAGKPMRMIPSRGMMQAFLETTRVNVPEPIYRFGLSTNEGLHETMKSGGRDMFQAFARLPQKTPQMADTFPALAEYAEAEIHDFYHQSLVSNIPENEQKLFAALIDYLLLISKSSAPFQWYAEKLADILIDMEHGVYDPHLISPEFIALFTEKATYVSLFEKEQGPFHFFWKTVLACDAKMIERYSNTDRLGLLNQRNSIIAYLADWLLNHESELERRTGLTLDSLMAFSVNAPGKEHFILMKIQARIQSYLTRETEEKSLPQLLHLLSPFKPDTNFASPFFRLRPTGRLLRARVLEALDKVVKADFSRSFLYAYEKQSSVLLDIIHTILSTEFLNYLEILQNLKKENPRAFEYVMSRFRATTFCDPLFSQYINRGTRHPAAFDLLYDPKLVNAVYASDQRTLLHRALLASDVELMLRLTNDGASVLEIPSAAKPCALALSLSAGQTELVALLVLANEHGAGWVDREKESVARIRRMASARIPCEEDQAWALNFAKKIPDDLIDFEKLEQETQQDKRELEALNKFMHSAGAKGKINDDDPNGYALFRGIKKWVTCGGEKPDLSQFVPNK